MSKCILNEKWITSDVVFLKDGTNRFCIKRVKIHHVNEEHVWIEGIGKGIIRNTWNGRRVEGEKIFFRARVAIEIV